MGDRGQSGSKRDAKDPKMAPKSFQGLPKVPNMVPKSYHGFPKRLPKVPNILHKCSEGFPVHDLR